MEGDDEDEEIACCAVVSYSDLKKMTDRFHGNHLETNEYFEANK